MILKQYLKLEKDENRYIIRHDFKEGIKSDDDFQYKYFLVCALNPLRKWKESTNEKDQTMIEFDQPVFVTEIYIKSAGRESRDVRNFFINTRINYMGYTGLTRILNTTLNGKKFLNEKELYRSIYILMQKEKYFAEEIYRLGYRKIYEASYGNEFYQHVLESDKTDYEKCKSRMRIDYKIEDSIIEKIASCLNITNDDEDDEYE